MKRSDFKIKILDEQLGLPWLSYMVTSQYSEGSLFRRSIIPKVHWSEGAFFRRCISPKICTYSIISLKIS